MISKKKESTMEFNNTKQILPSDFSKFDFNNFVDKYLLVEVCKTLLSKWS